jgi:thiol-disulfide isomerase/thioredoxin
MKKLIVLTFVLFFSIALFGQESKKIEPFIIKGQIIDYSIFTNNYYVSNMSVKNDNFVSIAYSIQPGKTLCDTTYLDETGNFFYKTNQFVKPVNIYIAINKHYFGGIYAAPGFDITFVTSYNSTNTISKITGRGSETYRYSTILDSIERYKQNNFSIWNLNETDYLNYINKEAIFKDSIAHAIFDLSVSKDNTIDSIGRIMINENMFNKLLALLRFSKPVKEGLISFVENNFDKEVLENPSKDEYLLSSSFQIGIKSEYGSIVNFLIKYHNPKDSIPDIMSLEYRLNKVNQIFAGEVRAFILYNMLINSFWNYASLESLNDYRNRLKPYLASLTGTYKKAIDSKFSEQEALIYDNEERVALKEANNAKAFIEKPAPLFELKSNTDQTYSLANFKGKVVLLNLWSSWCDLCREENKTFSKLIQKYKKDQRIAFVSIAVYDKLDAWQKILKEDQPEGIQLFDKDRVVLNAYIEEHVPKFILIDKEGNVVNFMAPKPSKGDELEKLIKKELE